MYLNVKMIEARGLSLDLVIILQLCKQNKFEDMSNQIESRGSLDLPWLFEHNLIEHVKAKKKSDTEYHTVRLSKKGQTYLDDVETPEITEEDIKIFEWLSNAYKNAGKEVGNRKKGLIWLSNFRVESGINRNWLVTLCSHFLKDDQQQQYSQKLQYVFWKPSNMYAVKFQLEESKLWQYYLANQDHFDNRVFPSIKN